MTPLPRWGGVIPLWLMQLGEVVFGGVGSGLYGMLMNVLLAVFIAGLMIGRTPEYLGKKIGVPEMKVAAIYILITPSLVLLGTALAMMTDAGRAGIFNPGPHGFSEVLYALSSAANNNGSAFAGLLCQYAVLEPATRRRARSSLPAPARCRRTVCRADYRHRVADWCTDVYPCAGAGACYRTFAVAGALIAGEFYDTSNRVFTTRHTMACCAS